MRLFGLGPTELIIILAIVLVLFGPKQIPKLSRMFGKAMKDVKDGLEGVEEEPAAPAAPAPQDVLTSAQPPATTVPGAPAATEEATKTEETAV